MFVPVPIFKLILPVNSTISVNNGTVEVALAVTPVESYTVFAVLINPDVILAANAPPPPFEIVTLPVVVCLANVALEPYNGLNNPVIDDETSYVAAVK